MIRRTIIGAATMALVLVPAALWPLYFLGAIFVAIFGLCAYAVGTAIDEARG